MSKKFLDFEIFIEKKVKNLKVDFQTLRIVYLKNYANKVTYEVQDKFSFIPLAGFSNLNEALSWAKRNDK